MPSQVAILHGWSDTSRSFANLRGFLSANGHDVKAIWLGDYVSLDDDVRVEDVAKRMEEVVGGLIADGHLAPPFDLIVHSTGALVAREWIATYYPGGRACPVRRLVMLAPANFGSKLASKGKSLVGRVAKGWKNGFQTGVEMLNALELASPYQWSLARRDLLDADGEGEGPYGPRGKVLPFVIIGTRPYRSGFRQIINEDGSDGTIRVPAANLNTVGLTIDFSEGGLTPLVRPWHRRVGDERFPFAVLPDRDHSTITDPQADSGAAGATSARLGALILEALACPDIGQYRRIGAAWDKVTGETFALFNEDAAQAKEAIGALFQGDAPRVEAFHNYMQIIALVRDDHGRPVDDYFLEFFAEKGRTSDRENVYFQKNVLEHVHVNGDRPNMRCLYADRTDLLYGYYKEIPKGRRKQLIFSISAAAPGPNIRYFDRNREGATGELVVHEEDRELREALGPVRLLRNTTHLVEIIIPRRPLTSVFRLGQES